MNPFEKKDKKKTITVYRPRLKSIFTYGVSKQYPKRVGGQGKREPNFYLASSLLTMLQQKDRTEPVWSWFSAIAIELGQTEGGKTVEEASNKIPFSRSSIRIWFIKLSNNEVESLSLSKEIILKLVEIEVEKWFWIRQTGWDVDVIRDRRSRSEKNDESRGWF